MASGGERNRPAGADGQSSDERRRFFRIDDTVKVSYRVLDQEESEFFAARSRPGNDSNGAERAAESDYDGRIKALIEEQRSEAPELAELASLLNKKINFLLGQLRLQDAAMQKFSARLRQVNISACGVAFEIDEAVPRAATVSLDLELQPSELTITTLATVVSCTPMTAAGRYFLRLDYGDIKPADQELLVGHIMARHPAPAEI